MIIVVVVVVIVVVVVVVVVVVIVVPRLGLYSKHTGPSLNQTPALYCRAVRRKLNLLQICTTVNAILGGNAKSSHNILIIQVHIKGPLKITSFITSKSGDPFLLKPTDIVCHKRK